MPEKALCLLQPKVLSCVIHMVVGKARHEVVAVIVIGLHSERDAVLVAGLLCRSDKVLGEKLTLLVEVVAGTLAMVRNALDGRKSSIVGG